MNSKVLLICCTKNRPHILPRMIKSFNDTKGSDDTKLIYCLDKEDINLAEYQRLLKDEITTVDTPNYQTKTFNWVTKVLFPDFDYHGIIIRTKNWDLEFIKTIEKEGKGWGIAHANSLWHDSDIVCRHPSGFIISANIIKVLDYAIYPELRHFKIDTYLRDLTEPLGLLFYRPDIVIEHMHAHVGKAVTDENYEWGYSSEEMAWGDHKYAIWRLMWADRDRKRIKRAIEKGQSNGTEKD
jgi:hypothetical protein